MSDEPSKSVDRLLHDLRERAKELNCLYEVQEILGTPGITIEQICRRVIQVLPPGWQYPDICQAEIVHGEQTYRSPGFRPSPWLQSAPIIVQDRPVGRVTVFYTEERPEAGEGPFLKEERRLIDTVAEQIGFHLLHEQLKHVFHEQQQAYGNHRSEWAVILDLLRRTDPALLTRITRKMVNELGWNGVTEIDSILARAHPAEGLGPGDDENRPSTLQPAADLLDQSDAIFALAARHMTRQAILDRIEKWSREDRMRFLVDVLVNPASSLAEIGAALERFRLLAGQGIDLTAPRDRWFRIGLIRRILSDEPRFIASARQHVDIEAFTDLMRRVIYPVGSHGRLGGKGAGLYLAAQILHQAADHDARLGTIRTPKTWYVSSDTVFHFMSHNDLEDIVELKYRDLGQVRQEYPYITHVFKNSPLPPEIAKGLALAIDDLGDVPLIVRSSSLLEDRGGAAFAGKYKSLFIANRGGKAARLAALSDAITEVFASMFGPDPIEYRLEHGLIDHHEEMGILIQEVVGTRLGPYHLPVFAGVAFSRNEFPWSSRINREDGLVRLVPGLGTRAVDRLSDDYPVLVAPGRPGLRVNTTADEVVHYSPKKVDLINLEARTFETVELHDLLARHGPALPLADQLVSQVEGDRVRPPSATIDFGRRDLVVTFDGLLDHTPFLEQVQAMLQTLSGALGVPVDIEFAHDGNALYLLQCRPQSQGGESQAPPVPRQLPPEKVLFTAHRYVSNAYLTDLTHIVYVDPERYATIGGLDDLAAVGRAVGALNQILPRRRFLLIGPGRWGSRGDIRLGVHVTYSDISNAAMLIEIASTKEGSTPEPSFGTHFFQDLVEASIRYLPLYPGLPGAVFNTSLLTSGPNRLGELAPAFASLADVLHVIDVPAVTGGEMVHVVMNADTEEAIAFLAPPSERERAKGSGPSEGSG
ncbi:MAG TPA: PEP/pyruvate-binding domain-containing protein [Anaerolineales bacterium]|nr:PEP/pyruvate-binding domain-containing protein [Anaerolineales bacterium]